MRRQLPGMTLAQFISFADAYQALGAEKQAEMKEVIASAPYDALDRNNLQEIEHFLRGAADNLMDFDAQYHAESINEYLHNEDEE